MPHAMTEEHPLLDPPERDPCSREAPSRCLDDGQDKRGATPRHSSGAKAPDKAPVPGRSV